MPDNTLKSRRQLAEYCKRLYDRDLVGSTQGNLSYRYAPDKILITPTGGNLGYLKASDIVVINSSGSKISGRGERSSEYDIHLKIYEARRDIMAVCHAHPVVLTAMSITRTDLSRLILPEIIYEFGIIPVLEFACPGTPELYDTISKYISRHEAFVFSNHGALTIGKSIEQVFNRMEMLERYARTLLAASRMGEINEIPAEMAKNLPGHERIAGQLSIE